MKPEISSAILRQVMDRADRAGGQEVCGLLRGRGPVIRQALATANIAADPQRAFEIEPAALLRAHRLARRTGGLEILGCYHSHPNGRTDPSPRDAQAAAADEKLWLIVTPDSARLWRARPHGMLHGRFDPVAFGIRTGKRDIRAVTGVCRHRTVQGWSFELDYLTD
ncbi:hypothetical protein GCM10023219_04390 [Stakelama sediminis]|uniref:Proteasome lid subunit RPN8/RPN11 n=1 Tax=Stakelama sediminis TaxID=463200 RepID=A0A840YU43_9SPHN|nr:M67 family metallopeptidase [Stakelama sediminis]MBB5717153.1 proteasome lid subunit RPN8/RPN11 [Stakelama sediminis]